jgi:dinuclear metal center YbgI/SA1388 family protein
MKLKEITGILESFIPLEYQEHYDNSGLAAGDPEMEVKSALLCIDVTLPVINEAIANGANLIISHHPVIFSPLKQLSGKNYTERILLKSIRNNIALYSAHTNLDNIWKGVNHKICEKLGLEDIKILLPQQNSLKKLVTFVPHSHADVVRNALFAAGAGHIGKYDSCSYNIEGQGSFRALEGSTPFAGEIGSLHYEQEIRLETIFQAPKKTAVLKALMQSHPYEEVAFDIYAVEQKYDQAGSGMIGTLGQPMNETDLFKKIKEVFGSSHLRHSKLLGNPLEKIAVCGGSGSFLIPHAISAGADLFLTGELKYHQFFDADNQIVLADIGHFESEKFTIEIFYDILRKNLPNFAVHFSTINTSPIYYF